jgi:predicted ATP-binding protein involved in virulence
MFLKSIELHNLRSIEHLRIDFARPGDPENIRKRTFILGENGAGKSSVLRAIGLLLAGSDALPSLLARPDDWIRRGTSEALLAGTLVTAQGEERTIALRLSTGQTTREIFEANRETLELLDRALANTPRNYPVFGYGTSRRLTRGGKGPSAGEPFGHPRAQSLATLFSADAELVGIEDWAIDLDYRFGEQGLERVRETFGHLLRDVEFKEIDKQRRELVFATPDGPIPLRLLSDGYQNVVAWCGDLLYRLNTVFENYHRPLEARALLLIDEIDLHLHPLWQRGLTDFLSAKLPNMQIVATTHSPITAHQAGEDELYVLRRPDLAVAAQLEHYAGAPNRLLLHQLIASPVFGLDTLDSTLVEGQKAELKALKTQRRRGQGEDKRIAALKKSLADLPDPAIANETDRKVAELLRSIDSKLSDGSAPT